MAVNSFANIACVNFFRPHYRKIVYPPGSTQSPLIDAKVIDSCGQFSYLPAESSKNRFIVWRASGQDLFLEEHAFGADLKNSAVCVQFQNSIVLPGTKIFETLDHTVVLLFTPSSVHRIVLPHPRAFAKKKPNQSILSELSPSMLLDTRNFCAINFNTNAAILPTSLACAMSASEEALFACGRTDGSILLVTLPSLEDDSSATQDVFQYSSALKRLWSGIVTPFSSSENNLACKIACLTFFPGKHDVKLLALHADYKLRCWSCKRKDVETDTDLTIFLDDAPKFNIGVYNSENWKIRSLITETAFYLAIFVYFNGDPQFLILSCDESNSPVEKIFLIDGSAEMELIDYQLLQNNLLSLWRSDDFTCWKYMPVDMINYERGRWVTKRIDFLETANFALDTENKIDGFVDYVFRPALFSLETIIKSIKISCKDFNVENSFTKPAPNFDKNPFALKEALRKYLHKVELKTESAKRNVHEKVISHVTVDGLMKNLRSCLFQYHKALSLAQGLFETPLPNLFGIIAQDRISFAAMVDKKVSCSLHATCEQFKFCNFETHFETRFTKCLHLIRNWFSNDEFKKSEEFLAYVWCEKISPSDVVKDRMLGEFLSDDRVSDTDFRLWLSKCEKTFVAGIEVALNEMQPNFELFLHLCEDAKLDKIHGENLLGKETVKNLVPEIVRKAVCMRLSMCRDLLLFLHAFQLINPEIGLSEEFYSKISHVIIPTTVKLCRLYTLLHWLLSLTSKAVLTNSSENLPSVANLNLSESRKSTGYNENSGNALHYLMDDFFGFEFTTMLNKGLRENIHCLSNFTSVCAVLLDFSLSYLWPIGHSLDLFDFLLQNKEFDCVVKLCENMHRWCPEKSFVRHYIKGEALLRLAKPDEAIREFRAAFRGIQENDVDLLNRTGLVGLSEQENGVQYYLNVADLFEQRGFNEKVIELCTECLSGTHETNKNAHSLRALVFKHQLALNNFDDAFESMYFNKDFASKRNCLRLFVVRLVELKYFEKLISYQYATFEQDLIEMLEHRARNSDIQKENVFCVLVAYCMKRLNYRKAAYYFYELSMRLKYEPVNSDTLKQRLRALTACVQNLSLVREDYRWIVRPSEHSEHAATSGVSPKRNLDDEELERSHVPKSSHITPLCDIKSELLLVQANLTICSVLKLYTYLSPKEAVLQLCYVKHFDEAACLSASHDIPLDSVLEHLAMACLKVVSKSRIQADDHRKIDDDFQWLEINKMFMKFTCFESRATNVGWKILENFLDHFSKIQQPTPLYRCACKKLLSYNQHLPTWLVAQFKKVDFPEFLRILIEFDQLDDAASQICEYIRSLLSGLGLEDFGLKNKIVNTEAPVVIPVSSIDLLRELYDKAVLKDTSKHQKKMELQECLKDYKEHLKRLTSTGRNV